MGEGGGTLFVNMFFAIICWFCAAIVGAIAFWAFKRKDPMHFWSGSTVSPEEIIDIPAYNRANGWMWAIYASGIALAGLLSLFNIMVGAGLLAIMSIPGTLALVFIYLRIYKKYKNMPDVPVAKGPRVKTPKAVVIVTISCMVVILALVGVLFIYGERDPAVSMLSGGLEIKGMYGLAMDFSEIADVSLLQKSMRDIGIGVRTNGYGGVGKALKGNFKSTTLGETLLFVQLNSVPTIRIERVGKKDVYISFRSSEKTEQLYRELIKALPAKEIP